MLVKLWKASRASQWFAGSSSLAPSLVNFFLFFGTANPSREQHIRVTTWASFCTASGCYLVTLAQATRDTYSLWLMVTVIKTAFCCTAFQSCPKSTFFVKIIKFIKICRLWATLESCQFVKHCPIWTHFVLLNSHRVDLPRSIENVPKLNFAESRDRGASFDTQQSYLRPFCNKIDYLGTN